MIRKILAFAGIILLFIAVSYAFVPEVLSGKIVNQSDTSGWRGLAQETIAHNSAHPDDKTAWTNPMFVGMPELTMPDDFD